MYKVKIRQLNFYKTLLGLALLGQPVGSALAQSKLPLIEASNEKALIQDGDYVKLDWKLDPAAKPDVYYVNIPTKKVRSNSRPTKAH